MNLLRVINESRQSVLGARIRMADTMRARLRGFLFRRKPAPGEGLLLAPCQGVHMYGMRYPLDVLFINESGSVIAAHAQLSPGQRTPMYPTARYALELPVGSISATQTDVGDQLSWKPAGEHEENGGHDARHAPMATARGAHR